MTLRSNIISFILFESVLICGAINIYYFFMPYFNDYELHINFMVTLTFYCVGWMMIWIGFLDKKINKRN